VAGDSVMLRVVRSASVSPTDGHRPASARHPLQRTASADGYRPASDRHPPQRTASATDIDLYQVPFKGGGCPYITSQAAA
jgi:hypothetical protein